MKTVMVIGGGASGVEIAQYFAELGSKVAIIELAERLLPREDEEVGQAHFSSLLAAFITASTSFEEFAVPL